MEVADTLKMRFPYQVWYCFSFRTCLFWIMVFSLCKLHYYSSNWWIVVAQKTPEFIAFSWYWVSAFTLPFKLFFNLNNRGCLWELLFLVSQHSFFKATVWRYHDLVYKKNVRFGWNSGAEFSRGSEQSTFLIFLHHSDS